MIFWLLLSILLISICGHQWRQRQKAEKSLRDAREQIHARESKLQTILDNAPIVFSAIDSQGIFRISEGKGLEKLGRRNNQSVGLSIYEMHGQNPIILDAVKRSFAGEQVATTFQLHGITYDLFIAPEKNFAGQVIGASMLSVDISDRKKIEEEKAELLIREKSALETSKIKSEFLATMSHEIRTPINGVLGMSHLLLETQLDPRQKEFAEAIRHSGELLLNVVNDILDLSKIEAGKMDLEEIHFNLRELLQHAVSTMSFTAATKKVGLRAEIAADVDTWVQGDPGRLRQILNNLIGNAIKFTNEGQVIVRVTTAERTPGDSRLKIEVEDSGIGISPAALKRIFVPFSQAEASMARRFGGSGLGLSISKQLAQKMGGEIGVSSQLGKGSVFWFTVTLRPGQAPLSEDLSKSARAAPLVPENRPFRVLVAEDNHINQIITVAMLKSMGCTADVVVNGLQAVEAVEIRDYDLILMDCQMPELDGLEATRRIRAGPPKNKNIPILAMTANAMKGDEEICLQAGMDGYVSKPISSGNLAKVLSRWVANRD